MMHLERITLSFSRFFHAFAFPSQYRKILWEKSWNSYTILELKSHEYRRFADVWLCPRAGSKGYLYREGSGAGPCPSSVQRDHIGTWRTGDIVGPLLHHRPPPLEQIGALIGPLNAFDNMGETGFSHFA